VSRLAAVALAAALAGCGSASYRLDRGIDRAALSAGDSERQRGLVAEGDRLWAERSNPGRLAEALARWESAAALKDDDWQTHARLARGYFFQADSVFAFQASGGTYPYSGRGGIDAAAAGRYKAAHRRGYVAALRGLAARSPEFEQRLQAGINMERAILVIGKDAAGLVYWYVANLGRWARADGVSALLRSRKAILASLYHLRRIDPRYCDAGADRLLGVYFAAAPSLVGGDLEASRTHFDAALRGGPSYLANAVLAAEFLDRKARDRASFEARLRGVLAQPNAAPELGPENDVERRKARALLQRADAWFRP
jgi:hypothetical protein